MSDSHLFESPTPLSQSRVHVLKKRAIRLLAEGESMHALREGVLFTDESSLYGDYAEPLWVPRGSGMLATTEERSFFVESRSRRHLLGPRQEGDAPPGHSDFAQSADPWQAVCAACLGHSSATAGQRTPEPDKPDTRTHL